MIQEIFAHPVIAMIVMLGVLVFVHEAGHFLVGRFFGVGVEIFSLGFGPRLFGFTRKGTLYQIALLPLGGFVKFAGAHPYEDVPPEFKGQELYNASKWARFCTLLAGPAANLVLAVLIYGILGSMGVEQPRPIIGQILPDSPAARAGLQEEDEILAIDDILVTTWTDLQKRISQAPSKELKLKVLRQGQTLEVPLSPEATEHFDLFDRPIKVGRIGIAYGSSASVISVIHPQSASAQAGLSTGFQVTKVEVFANETSIPGLEREVETFKQLLDVVAQGGSLPGVHLLRLSGRPYVVDRGEKKSEAETKAIEPPTQTFGIPFKGESLESLGIRSSELAIGWLDPGTESGLKLGDVLLGANGKPLRHVYDLVETLQKNTAAEMTFQIHRDGKEQELSIKLKATEVQKAKGREEVFMLPASFYDFKVFPKPRVEHHTGLTALTYGVRNTAEMSSAIVVGIWELITGQIPIKSLGGPVMIAKVAGDSARMGLEAFAKAMAVISVNLGVLNLFPIPALDGGQILLVLYEATIRRRISPQALENFQKIGFVLILALLLLSTYNDFSRFWTAIFRSLSNVGG